MDRLKKQAHTEIDISNIVLCFFYTIPCREFMRFKKKIVHEAVV